MKDQHKKYLIITANYFDTLGRRGTVPGRPGPNGHIEIPDKTAIAIAQKLRNIVNDE